MDIQALRASLADKVERGVKQVRVSTVLADLPQTPEDAFPGLTDDKGLRQSNRELRERVKTLERERRNAAARAARSETALREQHAVELANARAGMNGTPAVGLRALAEQSDDDPKWYGDVEVKGVLVGTAEAAAMLGVERPRIGRWVSLGKLPQPLAVLRATPVWFREDIQAKRESVESRRKPRRESSGFPSADEIAQREARAAERAASGK